MNRNSANHLRANLSSIFTQMQRHGHWLGNNPVRATQRLAVDEPVPDTMSATWVRPCIEAAPTRGWRVVLAVAAFTGMRRSEIGRAFSGTWPDVDLDERLITIRKSKRKRVRRVAIHAELLAILRDARTCNVVLPSSGALAGSNDIVPNALMRAGIKEPGDAVFKTLRGTWASQMIACGASSDITEYMGWGPRSSSVMRLHYVAYPADVLRREIDKLTWPKTKEGTNG